MAYLHKRSISISDPRATELFTDIPSTSNRVTRHSVWQVPSFLHAVRLTSSAIARTDLNVYRMLRDGGRDVDEQHPAQELLTFKANAYQSSFVFIQGLISNALVGDGYGMIDRDEMSNPLALHLVDPQSVYPVQEFSNGRLVNAYYGINTNAGQIAIHADDMIHIRNLSFGTGLSGVDLVHDSQQALSRAQSIQKFSSKYFDNGSHIDRFLKLPGWLSQEQAEELRISLGSLHGGTNNVGKLAILQGGSELGSLPLNAEQSQLTESQETTLTDMSNLLGCVSSKLGARNSISYGSLSEDNKAFVSDTLDYWFTCLESELNVKLIRYREKRFIEFDRESLQTSDPDYADSLIRQFQGKALSWEELRSKLKRTTDTKGLTFGSVPGQEPEPPALPQVPKEAPPEPEEADQPLDGEFGADKGNEGSTRAANLSRAALQRIKDRLTKAIASDPDLSKHYDVIRAAMPDDHEQVIESINIYQEELNHCLPEQRQEVISLWNIEAINNAIWK